MSEFIPKEAEPLAHDIYLTVESIALAALVDQLYERLDHPKEREE